MHWRRSGKTTSLLILSLTVVIIAATVWWFVSVTPDENVEPGDESTVTRADSPLSDSGMPLESDTARTDAPEVTPGDLQLAIEAVAAAEDAQYRRSLDLWTQLVQQFPSNADLQLNQAVTVLKWIDETNGRVSGGMVAAEDRERLQAELETAYSQADEVIASLAELETGDPRVALLESALLEAKARQLTYPNDQQLRRQAAEVLAEVLQSTAGQPLLASQFDDLVQELAGSDETLASKNADFLLAAWHADPRNLYLLVRAGENLLGAEDKRVTDLLQPSLDLVQPMLSMMQSMIDRIKPQELFDTSTAAIEDGDWRTAQRLRMWFNVLKGTSGFRPDTRLVKPDIMALLDTSFLNEFASRVPPQEPAANLKSIPPEYDFKPLASKASVAEWYDFDLDLDFDVVVAEGQQLSLRVLDSQGQLQSPEQLASGLSLRLPFEIDGVLPVDLFEVDDPSRPRLPANVAELMSNADRSGVAAGNESRERQSDGQAAAISGARHDTLQELIVWGSDGVAIVSLRFNASEEGVELYTVAGNSPEDDSQASSTRVEPASQQEAATKKTSLEGGPDFNEAFDAPALTDLTGVLAIEDLDIEADGDLDLVVATSTGIQVYQNNGNRQFENITRYSNLPDGDWQVAAMQVCDVDRDLDQDVVCVSKQFTSLLVLENILHGQFRYRLLDESNWPQLAEPTSLDFGDLDGNGSWDWVVSDSEQVYVTTTALPSPGELLATRTTPLPFTAADLSLVDVNNDSYLDLMLASQSGVSVSVGMPTDGKKIAGGDAPFFQPAKSVAAESQGVGRIHCIDANQDGRLECLAVGSDGASVGFPNGVLTGSYVQARVRGINDVNGGGRVNHFAIGSTLELWSGTRRQARVIRQPVVHFGIGDTQPKNLRIIFTNGLTQNYEQPEPSMLVEERQELKGSCPFVYGWNGTQFELITDLLWNAPLGLQVARGEVLPDRRWEYLLLPGRLMQPKEEKYELRITEELWELAYFDHIRLTAVDHPADIRVFTNEKVGPPGLAEPRLFAVRNAHYPQAASNHLGRDLLQELTRRDGRYAQAFDRLLLQGLAEPHWIELDFNHLADQLDDPQRAWRMYLTGWLHPTDTSLNIGISQDANRMPPEPPSLWSVDAGGEWQQVQPFMGFPGGKPKSIVVDLHDAFISSDKRLRIACSQQIYWDEIFISADDFREELRLRPMQLDSAELHYRGFSQLLPKPVDQPHWYDYQRVSQAAKWPELEGPFTRFGDVRWLLAEDDDLMVVMTAGDEIQARFDFAGEFDRTSGSAVDPTLKAFPLDLDDRQVGTTLPSGWQRDFVLHSTGWDKDADLNTLAGQGALPLPFKAQESYPPPPEQASEAARVREQNAKWLTRFRQYRPSQQVEN